MDKKIISFILLYSWILLDSLLLNERIISCEKLDLLAVSFAVFICAHMLRKYISFPLLAVIFAVYGIFEATIACGQYAEIIDSNHLSFVMTGTFKNPAQLGAWMGISILCIIYLIHRAVTYKWHMMYFIIYILALILTGSVFLGVASRASWLSFTVVIGWYIWKQYGSYRKYSLVFGLIVLMSLPALYQFKKASADGRWFIWKVSTGMIAESPIIGKGAESFAAGYMLAQADYFRKHPCSEYQMKATNNIHAFNEYLRVLCEYGLIGLILLLIVLYSGFTTFGALPVKALLLFLGLFACFSYIVEIPSLFLTASFLYGCLPSEQSDTLSFKKRIYIIIFCLTVTAFGWYDYYVGNTIRKDRYNRAYILKQAYTFYKQQDYKQALPFLELGYHYNPVKDICLDLGNCHYYLGNYRDAEYFLMQARWMLPGHILPRYYLFRLYAETGRDKEAYLCGNEILSTDFMQEGSIAKEVKYYIKEYLRKDKSSSQIDSSIIN